MPPKNLDRMIALANEFFGMKEDRDQIAVTDRDLEKLRSLHPATLMEESTPDGPICWILIFPTTSSLMQAFLHREISEQQLLDRTPLGIRYDALYLCSALVLPEYRRTGLAVRTAGRAVQAILNDHPVRDVFYWGFSVEGRGLAEALARTFRLPLHERGHD